MSIPFAEDSMNIRTGVLEISSEWKAVLESSLNDREFILKMTQFFDEHYLRLRNRGINWELNQLSQDNSVFSSLCSQIIDHLNEKWCHLPFNIQYQSSDNTQHPMIRPLHHGLCINGPASPHCTILITETLDGVRVSYAWPERGVICDKNGREIGSSSHSHRDDDFSLFTADSTDKLLVLIDQRLEDMLCQRRPS